MPVTVNRSLAEPNAIKAVWIEPGAMHAGDAAIEVGDAGNHRRPGLRRQVLVRSIIAARMEAQAATVVHVGNSASPEIGLDHGPLDLLRYRKQPSRGLLRSSRCCRTNGFWDE